jgi:hypothetical protein
MRFSIKVCRLELPQLSLPGEPGHGVVAVGIANPRQHVAQDDHVGVDYAGGKMQQMTVHSQEVVDPILVLAQLAGETLDGLELSVILEHPKDPLADREVYSQWTALIVHVRAKLRSWRLRLRGRPCRASNTTLGISAERGVPNPKCSRAELHEVIASN